MKTRYTTSRYQCELDDCDSYFCVIKSPVGRLCSRHYNRYRKYGVTSLDCEDSIVDLPGEIWKDVVGYEGLYLVSNKGRVQALERRGVGFSNTPRRICKAGGTRYPHVTLSKDKKQKTLLIHRLVMLAFTEQPAGKTMVNHIDCDKKNNNLENLEWCTQKENAKHAYENGRFPIRTHCITCSCANFGITK